MTDQQPDSVAEAAPIVPKGAQEVFLGLGGVAFAALILCLGAYRVFGAQLTAGLDEACAEAAYVAGQKLEAGGNLAQAVQKYRQAMEGQFASDGLRTQCGLAIGDLLFKQDRFGEALEAYQALPEQAFNRAGAYTGYVTALWRAGNLDEATRLGMIWLQLAEQEGQPDQQVWARNVLMQAANAKGDLEGALAQGNAILALEPGNDARVTVARILLGQGKAAEAKVHAEALVKNTDSPSLQRAGRQLLEQLSADAARTGAS